MVNKDADGYQQLDPTWKTPDVFHEALYVPLSKVIVEIAEEENISTDELVKLLPNYIENNIENMTVFCGGFKYRLRGICGTIMVELVDYMLANDSKNALIPMPNQYKCNSYKSVTVPRMLQVAHSYTIYLRAKNEKMSMKDAKRAYHDLEEDTDYKFVWQDENVIIVNIFSKTACILEGTWMDNCTRSAYLEGATDGTWDFFSAIDKKTMVGACTMRKHPGSNVILETKGKHNGPIMPDIATSVRKFIVEQKWTFAPTDARDYGFLDWPKPKESQNED